MALWLSTLGAKVYGYALEADTHPSLFAQLGLANKINHKIGDICELENFKSYVNEVQPDFVFHLAAQSLVLRSYRETPMTWDTNVMGTVNLLEALRGLENPCSVVMVTTDKVYHNNEWEHGYRETDRLGGIDPYSASKAASELVINSYRAVFAQESRPITMSSARAGNVIGGGDWCENRLVPDIARALQKGVSLETRNPGAVRPWQHVLEPISGYMLLAEKLYENPDIGEAFNFGPVSSDNRTVEEVIITALKTWPGSYHAQKDKAAPHEAGLLKLTIDRAQSRLGWHPRWDFETAISKTIEWYKSVHEGKDPLEMTLNQITEYSA